MATKVLLEDIHSQVRATLKRIDMGLVEIHARERALASGAFRAAVRKETQAWFHANPDRAHDIAEFFAPDPSI
jgi:hypothetical protein